MDYTPLELGASLFKASQMLGHNNKSLTKAITHAQMIIGNEQDLNEHFETFEVDEDDIQEASVYLDDLKQLSKVHLNQSRRPDSEATTEEREQYRKLDAIISEVTALDYSKMVF